MVDPSGAPAVDEGLEWTAMGAGRRTVGESVVGTERVERFPLEALARAVANHGRVVDISGVSLDALAYVAVRLGRDIGRPLAIVTPEAADARRVVANLRFFGGDPAAAVLLPNIEASPYGHLSPDRKAVMETMARLTAFAWDQFAPYTVMSAATFARRRGVRRQAGGRNDDGAGTPTMAAETPWTTPREVLTYWFGM